MQTSMTQFIANAREEVITTWICSGGNDRSTIPVHPGANVIDLLDGCSLSSDSFYIAPTRNATIELDTWTLAVPVPDLLNFTDIVSARFPADDIDISELLQIAQDLTKQKPIVPIDELVASRVPVPTMANYSSATALIITGCTLLALTALFAYLYCRYRGGCRRHRRFQPPRETHDQAQVEDEPMDVD